MRSFKDRLLLGLKGMAMGAADVVPGVSGGTIAFITGIYHELINTLGNLGFNAIQVLFKGQFKAFWKAVNGGFILPLVIGIAVSILSLARLLSRGLEEEPIAVWSFFFGLVAASIPIVARQVNTWRAQCYFAFGVGAIAAFLITELPVVDNPEASWYLFLSGAIAICAMILPGISGSFILLLMGSYLAVLDAINDRDLVAIAVFGSGAVVGLLSFSKVLQWMFKRYHDVTVALLSGFLLGSLNKIWPWKKPLETITKYPGEEKEKVVVLEDENLFPWNFAEQMGEEPQVTIALGMALFGVFLIFGIDRLAHVLRGKASGKA